MKIKTCVFATLSIAVILICTYSCRKELLGNENTINSEFKWARDYYAKTILPNEGNIIDARTYVEDPVKANLMSQRKENIKIPIWERATAGKTNLYSFIEIPLKYTMKVVPIIYLSVSQDDTNKEAEEEVLKGSFDRLIIYKNTNGLIDKRVVSFIPTKSYLKRHEGDISHNRINKLDKDFDGMLVYRQWNGKFLFVLFIKNGIAVKKVSLRNDKMKFEKTANSKSVTCVNIELREWFTDCTYEGDNPIPIYCGEPYYEVLDSWLECTEDPDPCSDPVNFGTGECPGNGTGGENEDCSAKLENITGDAVSENIGSTALESNSTTRKKEYKWKFLKSLTWYYWSKEEGTHKLVGNEWRWQALTHKEVKREGSVIGGSLRITINNTNATIGLYFAGMTINYDLHGEAFCKNSPLDYSRSDVKQNSPVWNVNDF